MQFKLYKQSRVGRLAKQATDNGQPTDQPTNQLTSEPASQPTAEQTKLLHTKNKRLRPPLPCKPGRRSSRHVVLLITTTVGLFIVMMMMRRRMMMEAKSCANTCQNLLYCSLGYIYKHIGTRKYLTKALWVYSHLKSDFFSEKKLLNVI